MSHYSLLVIGDNIEEQLAPYSEEIEAPRYVDTTEDLVELADRSLAFHREHYPEKVEQYKDRSASALGIPQRHELVRLYKEGEDIEFDGTKVLTYTTYNPKSKWDWYSIGGRWRGFFQLKPGATGPEPERHYSEGNALFGNGDKPLEDLTGRTDQAIKGDIDFEAMRAKARTEAEKEYDAMLERTKGIDPPKLGWKGLLDAGLKEAGLTREADIEKLEPIMDAARKVRQEDKWLKAAMDPEYFTFEDPFEAYCMDREDPRQAYIDAAVNRVGVPFAILKDGEWYERGKMGWWGMVADEEDAESWTKKVSELIDSLSDDTLLTFIDCHI